MILAFLNIKGLSYEIDFKNVDKNWQIFALIRVLHDIITQTDNNRNIPYTFLHYEIKIIRAPKNFKNQPHPLLRPSSVKFCRNF
jgi:hypothetical protein